MNSDTAVIATAPAAYRRHILHGSRTIRLPVVFIVLYIAFFLIGLPVGGMVYPNPEDRISSLLTSFLLLTDLQLSNLPQNIIEFLNYNQSDLIFFGVAIGTSFTFLAPPICACLCALRATRFGIAAMQAFAMLRIGELSSAVFLSFLCREALFSAMLIYLSAHSVFLSRTLPSLGWKRTVFICRELCLYFAKSLLFCILFLALSAIICLII